MYDPVLSRELSDLRLAHLRIKSDIAWLRFMLAFRRFARLAVKAGFKPDQPRDDHGRWTDTGSVGALFDALLQDFEGDIVAEDVAYPGDFHDAVKDYFVKGAAGGRQRG